MDIFGNVGGADVMFIVIVIAAGDRGELTYQGTRFKQFIRDVI